MDAGAVWLDTAEDTLSSSILVDGIVGFLSGPVAAATANTMAAETDGSTYIVNYQSGADVIVAIGDQSTKYYIILHANE
jgi:hypothetical protein